MQGTSDTEIAKTMELFMVNLFTIFFSRSLEVLANTWIAMSIMILMKRKFDYELSSCLRLFCFNFRPIRRSNATAGQFSCLSDDCETRSCLASLPSVQFICVYQHPMIMTATSAKVVREGSSKNKNMRLKWNKFAEQSRVHLAPAQVRLPRVLPGDLFEYLTRFSSVSSCEKVY